MNTIQRVVYATDLSAASDAAWDEARRLGQLFDAEILVLHVATPPLLFLDESYVPARTYDELRANVRRDAETRLDHLLGSIRGSGLKVRVCLDEGPAAQRILAAVDEEKPDLLVIGTHGRTGFDRIILGSVADRLIRQAACPVLTVPGGRGAGPRPSIRRICYATDFSPTARAAWPLAVVIDRDRVGCSRRSRPRRVPARGRPSPTRGEPRPDGAPPLRAGT
jgi:nucleotide-binding universal stress UspA family protein